ncbi:MAG: hypothetical protein IPH74_14400 [Bacteroidetes bacterium]|nr:hypothetical protein [Bacteroidota bacterium]
MSNLFELESGKSLLEVETAYTTFGTLNADKSNGMDLSMPLVPIRPIELVWEWWRSCKFLTLKLIYCLCQYFGFVTGTI